MSDQNSESELNTAQLTHWLSDSLQQEVTGLSITGRPAGGFSAETIIGSAHIDGQTKKFVVRLETPEPAVYPAQSKESMPEIEIQYRIMRSLSEKTELPIAPLYGYEPTTNVLGTQFFVMGFVDGVVPIESPPYTTEGFFTEASSEQRTALLDGGLTQLANLHSYDPHSLQLEWLFSASPGGRHLLDLWQTFTEQELRGRNHPNLQEAFRRLQDTLPADSRLSLCWGDPRPGNIIWNNFAPACLTDFEAACIGPPEFDLAWWLMFDRTMHDEIGIARAAGDLSREEQKALYFQRAGFEPFSTTEHELFAAARYSTIVVRVMNRLEQRGLLPPNSDIWLNNPASACLRTMLSELRN